MPIFTPRPSIRAVPIDATHDCLVIDGALREPERWVAHAIANRAGFSTGPRYAYPGPELAMPDAFAAELDDFFRVHIRGRLGGRRTLGMSTRMAMVTVPPHDLQPRQWMCHRDSQTVEPGQCLGASVLYLFHDEQLGGTSFYRPRHGAHETALLIHDSGTMDAASFGRKYGVSAGYLTESNDWFERTLTVAPAFNRMVFYDGSLFHNAHLPAPQRLVDDPATGRLTINGFFICAQQAR
jgi:hypothetical protein